MPEKENLNNDEKSIYSNLKNQMNRYFKESFRLVDDLNALLKIEEVIEHLEFTIKFENRIDMIPAFVEYLISKTSTLFDFNKRCQLKLGLSEIIMNAIEHGNLNITYEEKTKALENGAEELKKLYKERSEMKENKNKKVTVNFKIKDNYCEWIIMDEGNGFNWRKYIDNIDNFSRDFHGMGIFLSKTQFDEIEYIGNGNTVRLRKYYP